MAHTRAFVLTALMVIAPGELTAAPPLHEQIDALIETQPGYREAAGIAGDASFLRQVCLDLTGTIPPAATVREFLADAAPDKRAQAIGHLLASPQHALRMQYVFDALLMERRPDKHVAAEAWQAYLRRSFVENKPWDQLVREILSADGAEEESRPAAKFLLDRELNVDEVTRDLGRISWVATGARPGPWRWEAAVSSLAPSSAKPLGASK